MNKYIDIHDQIKSLVEELRLDEGASELLSAAQKHNISVYALNLLIECQSNAVNAAILNQDGISYKVLPPKEEPLAEPVKDKVVASEVPPKPKEPKETKEVELKATIQPMIEKQKLMEAKLKTIKPKLQDLKPLVEAKIEETPPKILPLALPKAKPELELPSSNGTWYALRPDGKNGFLMSKLTANPEERYYYVIEQDSNDTAQFSVVEDPSLQQFAISSDSIILREACEYENLPQGSKSISVISRGKLKRHADEWSIVQKAKIRFNFPKPKPESKPKSKPKPVSIEDTPAQQKVKKAPFKLPSSNTEKLKAAFLEGEKSYKKAPPIVKQKIKQRKVSNETKESKEASNSKMIDYLLYGSILLTLILIGIIVWKFFL